MIILRSRTRAPSADSIFPSSSTSHNVDDGGGETTMSTGRHSEELKQEKKEQVSEVNEWNVL